MQVILFFVFCIYHKKDNHQEQLIKKWYMIIWCLIEERLTV